MAQHGPAHGGTMGGGVRYSSSSHGLGDSEIAPPCGVQRPRGHPTSASRHPTPASRHPPPDTRHPPPASRHPTPDTRHPTPDTRLPTPDTRHPMRAMGHWVLLGSGTVKRDLMKRHWGALRGHSMAILRIALPTHRPPDASRLSGSIPLSHSSSVMDESSPQSLEGRKWKGCSTPNPLALFPA
jgi:hypothetical protein